MAGQCVGALGVSGVKSDQDAQIANAGVQGNTRTRLVKWRVGVTFAALCVIWGLPYFFIKLALTELTAL